MNSFSAVKIQLSWTVMADCQLLLGKRIEHVFSTLTSLSHLEE